MIKRIVIIGSGNVAYSLALALKQFGNAPVQIFARNRTEGEKLAGLCGSLFSDDPLYLAQADLYIISVADKAVRQVAGSLHFADSVVAHTAASLDLEVFGDNVIHKAVLYPLQTFTKGRYVSFGDVPLLIEGNTAKALDTVAAVASQLSGNVAEVDFGRRIILHAAAVFAANFTNYMYVSGEELARKAGFDFAVLKPLIAEVASKAIAAASPRDIQTGPAVRGDYQTIDLHAGFLREKPELRNIYINLSEKIWETLKKT